MLRKEMGFMQSLKLEKKLESEHVTNKNFKPIDGMESPRFSQIATFARTIHTKDLDEVNVAFVGVPYDGGTSYRTGTRYGPSAIREQSRILRSYNRFLDTSPFDTLNVIDYGDVDIVPGNTQKTYAKIEATISSLTSRNVFPLIAGGDHSITYPILKILYKKYGKINLVHFDSHYDFWDSYWGEKFTHGTWLHRALDEKLLREVVQIGIRGSLYSKSDNEYANFNKIHVFDAQLYHDKNWCIY